MPERWPEPMPDWPIGTDFKVVFDWEWERQCMACFACLCEWCEGGPTDNGLPCICDNPAHAEELMAVE